MKLCYPAMILLWASQHGTVLSSLFLPHWKGFIVSCAVIIIVLLSIFCGGVYIVHYNNDDDKKCDLAFVMSLEDLLPWHTFPLLLYFLFYILLILKARCLYQDPPALALSWMLPCWGLIFMIPEVAIQDPKGERCPTVFWCLGTTLMASMAK